MKIGIYLLKRKKIYGKVVISGKRNIKEWLLGSSENNVKLSRGIKRNKKFYNTLRINWKERIKKRILVLFKKEEKTL